MWNVDTCFLVSELHSVLSLLSFLQEAPPQPASDEDLKGKTIESTDQQPLTEQAA